MPTLAEVEKLAFELPESERAMLVAHLLDSLAPVLHDEDDGLAEAERRFAEFEGDPRIAISLDEMERLIKSRRGFSRGIDPNIEREPGRL